MPHGDPEPGRVDLRDLHGGARGAGRRRPLRTDEHLWHVGERAHEVDPRRPVRPRALGGYRAPARPAREQHGRPGSVRVAPGPVAHVHPARIGPVHRERHITRPGDVAGLQQPRPATRPATLAAQHHRQGPGRRVRHREHVVVAEHDQVAAAGEGHARIDQESPVAERPHRETHRDAPRAMRGAGVPGQLPGLVRGEVAQIGGGQPNAGFLDHSVRGRGHRDASARSPGTATTRSGVMVIGAPPPTRRPPPPHDRGVAVIAMPPPAHRVPRPHDRDPPSSERLHPPTDRRHGLAVIGAPPLGRRERRARPAPPGPSAARTTRRSPAGRRRHAARAR